MFIDFFSKARNLQSEFYMIHCVLDRVVSDTMGKRWYFTPPGLQAFTNVYRFFLHISGLLVHISRQLNEGSYLLGQMNSMLLIKTVSSTESSVNLEQFSQKIRLCIYRLKRIISLNLFFCLSKKLRGSFSLLSAIINYYFSH